MKKFMCLLTCASLIQALEPAAVFAQTSFAKMLHNNFGVPKVTAHPSGDLFVYGDGNHILRLTSNGTVKWQNAYLRARSIGHLVMTPTDDLLVTYIRNDTAPPFKTHPGLMRLDSLGNVLWSKEDTGFHAVANPGFKLHLLQRGSEILWVQQSGFDTHIDKIDYNGNILSRHYYNVLMYDCLWAPDNYIYGLGNSSQISKIDTAGYVSYLNLHIGGDRISLYSFVLKGNDLYMSGYYWPNYPSFTPAVPAIFRMNTSGTIISAHVFALHNDSATTGPSKIIPTPDGGFILLLWRFANRMVVIRTDSLYQQLSAWDSQTGTFQWPDGTLTADGGFAFSAFHNSGPFTNKILVLKTGLDADLSSCFYPIAIDSVYQISPQFGFFNANPGSPGSTWLVSNIDDSLVTPSPLNYCLGVDVAETEAIPSIHVYPNPSNGKFHISSVEKVTNWKITTLTGKCILRRSYEREFDLSMHPGGIYIFEGSTENGIVTRQRIIVR